jgi:hypothetical protein
MKWAIYVACVGNTRNLYKTAVEKSGNETQLSLDRVHWKDFFKTEMILWVL